MSGEIELVHFQDCPNAHRAREALTAALSFLELPMVWTEWDLEDPGTPERFRAFGSPTVLVNGADVTGTGPGTSAMACRADGAPSAEVILRALES